MHAWLIATDSFTALVDLGVIAFPILYAMLKSCQNSETFKV